MKTENFNEKSDQIFMLIEKFQNDSLKSYELFDKSKFIEKLRMSITIQKSKFASKLTTIKSMLEKWNNIANDPTSNDQTLLKETHSAQDAQSRLAVSIDEFKSICFRGKIAEFYQHDGKNSFGTLKFSWFNQINIKNFEYIDLMPHIKNIRGHADLNKEKDFLFLHDQYEFLCVCLENLHTVVFVRDRKGVNRNTLILFLFDEKKQIKDTMLMHLGEYAYFGFIRACGNKVVFSYGHDDEIKSFLCVLGEHLNLLHKIEHENNQLLVGANESFIYTSSNSEQAKASLNLKQSPIFVYDWSLKLVKKVGQRTNKKGAFYLPNYIFNLEFRNEKYYIFEEYSKGECRMNIIDEQTGLQIKTIQINDHFKCSHIDTDNRLILVNYQSLIYLSPNGEVLKEIKIINCPDFGHFWHFDRNNTLHLCTYNKDDDKERKLLFKRLKL